MQKGIRQAQAQVVGFKKIGEGLASFGAGMSKYVTLPLVAAGVVAAKFAIDFQQQMEMIHTQAGASQREVDKMSKSVLALAGPTATAPEKLAEGLYHIESVGLRGAAALNVLKVAALGAKVGNADLEDTTNALAGAWKVGIKGVQNMRGAMGLLNATVGAGNMRMGDLAAAFSTGVLPAAKTAGVSLRDVGSALALMADEAMPPQVAATRLRMAFSMMASPSNAAAKALAAVGLSSTSLASAMQKGGLMPALAMLKQHMAGLSRVDKEQLLGHAFGGAKSGSTMMALIDGLDKLRQKYVQVGAGAHRFNSDVAKTQQTAAYKLSAAWASIQASLIVAGGAIAPIFATIAAKVASVAAAFTHLSPAAQHWVLVGLAILAVMGPMLFIVGKMIIFGAQLAEVFMAIGATGAIILGVVAAVILIGVALVIAYEKVGWFHRAVDTAFHLIVGVVKVAVAGIVAEFNLFKRIGAAVLSFVIAHWRQLILALGPVGLAIDFLTAHMGTFEHWAVAAIKGVMSAAGWLADKFHWLEGKASGPLGAITGFFGDIVGMVKSVVSWIGKIHFPSPPGWVKSIAGGAASGLSKAAGFLGMGATGGIVTRPTHSLIGEAGPEAVIPLNRMPGASALPGGTGGGGGVTVVVQNPTFLSGSRQSARELASMLKPELDRIIYAR